MLKNLSLNITITIAILIGITIPVSISTWYFLSNQKKYFEIEIEKKIDSISTLNSQVLWYLSSEWAEIIVDSLLKDKSIVEITLYDDQGNVFLSKYEKSRAVGELISISRPLEVNNKKVGKVKLVINKLEINEQIETEKTRAFQLALFQVLLALIILMPLMYYKVLLPIKRLVKQSQKIANNKLDKAFVWNRTDELGTLGRRLEYAREEIQTLVQELQESANKDPLTNVYNRRFFTEVTNSIVKKLKRDKKSFCILIFDIDDFKQVNDSYGHQIGDKVIIDLSKTITSKLRQSDIVARFGGEEFVVLLQDTDIINANNIAEEIRKSIELKEIKLEDNSTVSYTVSIGVTEVTRYNKSCIYESIKRADDALYKAKEKGKNIVECIV